MTQMSTLFYFTFLIVFSTNMSKNLNSQFNLSSLEDKVSEITSGITNTVEETKNKIEEVTNKIANAKDGNAKNAVKNVSAVVKGTHDKIAEVATNVKDTIKEEKPEEEAKAENGILSKLPEGAKEKVSEHVEVADEKIKSATNKVTKQIENTKSKISSKLNDFGLGDILGGSKNEEEKSEGAFNIPKLGDFLFIQKKQGGKRVKITI